MFLTGCYYHALEQKGRVSIPKKFRVYFENNIVITLGLDGCLFGFHKEEFQAMLSQKQFLPLESKTGRDWIRLLTNSAIDVSIDAQGRILIPEALRQKTGIQKEIAIVGSLNRIEFWNQQTYHQYIQSIESQKETIAQKALLENEQHIKHPSVSYDKGGHPRS